MNCLGLVCLQVQQCDDPSREVATNVD